MVWADPISDKKKHSDNTCAKARRRRCTGQGNPGVNSENKILLEIVRAAVRDRGPLSFADFMDLALYAPVHGYYHRTHRPQLGPAGDFFTGASSNPVFGRIWARFFRQKLAEDARTAFQSLETRPGPTSNHWNSTAGTVHEFGGHRGQFRTDVLAECPDLPYRIIEAGEALPDRLEGVVFSNELIDALPFQRLRLRHGAWREIRIDVDAAGSLREIETEPGADLVALLPTPLRTPPPEIEAWEIELRPRADAWLRDIAARLVRGCIVTVDYGATHEEYFAKPRPAGTLRCYYRHTRTDDPLLHLGEQDITADVDFTALIETGEAAGLETVLFADQAHALLEIGRDVIAEIVSRDGGRMSRERNAIHQLIHPAHMGARFKVLIQRKR